MIMPYQTITISDGIPADTARVAKAIFPDDNV
jgi:hypothetical protein